MDNKGDMFEGISLEELAGSENPQVQSPESQGVKQGDGTSKVKEATQEGGENKQDPNEDPDAIDITELAGTETSEEEGDGEKSKTKQDPQEQESQTKSPSSHNATTSLASALQEMGVLSSFNEEEFGESENKGEFLVEAIRKEIYDQRYADLNEDQQKYLKALENGVPERTFHEHTSNAEQYEKIADDQISENKGLTHELIRRSLIVKGVDPDAAEELATTRSEKENFGEYGIKAKQELVSYEKSQLQEKIEAEQNKVKARQEKEQEELKTLKAQIDQNSEILPGVKINSQTKNKIFDSMTAATGEVDGSPVNAFMQKYRENPEFRLRAHAMMHLTKDLTDFSKFTKTAKSKAIAKLNEELQKGQTTKTGSHKTGTPGGRTAREIAASLPDNF